MYSIFDLQLYQDESMKEHSFFLFSFSFSLFPLCYCQGGKVRNLIYIVPICSFNTVLMPLPP